jgi:thiol-disulfide isomerase/thioredoxin
MLAAGTLAVLYVVFVASSKPEPSTGLARFATGDMRALAVMEAPPSMPSRTIQDAAGQSTTLHDVAGGEIMVLNVWGTFCAPCVHEMPTLAALQRRYEGRIRVVAVSVDGEGKRDQARQQLAQLSDNTLPFFIDTTRGVAFDVLAPGMPVTIVYDRAGREVARLAGGADWSSDEAAALIDAVLAEG